MESLLTKDRNIFATYHRIHERKASQEGAKGFTLIELLIVIVVLGILAAVVVFALGGITGKSAVSACEADGATIETAMAAFSANNPAVLITGPAAGATTPASNLVTPDTTLGAPYIQSWPNNPTHYAFSIAPGSSGPPFVQGTLEITPAVGGVAGSATIPYAGVASCNGVS